MSKLAILLCLVLFASAGHGRLWTRPLQLAQMTARDVIDVAISKVASKLKPTREKVDNEISKVFEGTIAFGHTAWKEIGEVTQKAVVEIDKFDGRFEDLDIFECTEISALVLDIASTVLSNTSVCFGNELETAYGYMHDFNEASGEVLDKLNQNREEVGRCNVNVDSLGSAVTASTCIQTTAADATWTADKFILELPGMVPDVSSLMENLVKNIDKCARWNGYFTLREKSSSVVDRTRECIQRKIVKSKNADITTPG